jgi:hypothetical protein
MESTIVFTLLQKAVLRKQGNAHPREVFVSCCRQVGCHLEDYRRYQNMQNMFQGLCSQGPLQLN